MRNLRSAKLIVRGTRETDKPSIRDLLRFELTDHEDAEIKTVGAWRLSAFDTLLPLAAGVRSLLALALISTDPIQTLELSAGNPVAWIITMIVLDIAGILFLRLHGHLHNAPSTIVQALCGYAAITGAVSVLVAWLVLGQPGVSLGLIALMVAGLGLVPILMSARSPAIALINTTTAALSAVILWQAPIIAVGLVLLSVMLFAFSIVDARGMLITLTKRLELDADARKAVRFVDEFENSGQGWFWETDVHGTLSYVSQQLADDFKCKPEELLGRRFTTLVSVDSSPDGAHEEPRTLGFHLSSRFGFSDVAVRAASDEAICWSLSGNPVFDELGRFYGFRGIGTDLTEQRRSDQEISRLAKFDSLTGLPNRAFMHQTLNEALRNASHRQTGCALFLIDLDKFKNVNDTLGHPVGDALLREVGDRLKNVLNDNGQVGRLGGDEFKAVLPGISEIGFLETLASTLIQVVSAPYVIEGHKISIGASLGIAIGHPGRCTADSLIRDADLALYAAKAAGRGQHKIFEPAMHSDATDRQSLENDLRQAVDRGELWVAYQPIVRAAGEEVCGFEALARWDHSKRGAVSPAIFIPLAEECGLIARIGTWVLDTAVAEAAKWPEQVRIAVNISPIQFNDPVLVQNVEAALRRNGLRSERLELEITEGVFLSDSDATDQTFAKLKALGVRLALDDFGTGYSSLGYLKKAPFDKIKIDQSFVRGASSKSNRNAAIIRAIVNLAENLGMDTCAEGVETHDDLQLIRELGCSQVQGYIFGRPVDAAEARKFATGTSIEADGYKSIREPRQRLMRRGVCCIDGKEVEVRLRNISVMGAQIECASSIAEGTRLTIDIIGVGPVVGTVRWTQSGKCGLEFSDPFDLARLAPMKQLTSSRTLHHTEPRRVPNRREKSASSTPR